MTTTLAPAPNAAAYTSTNLNAWPEADQRVQLLAESGIPTVPSRYIRPVSQRPSEADTIPHGQIPVIDLSDLETESRRSCLDLMKQACEQWGFFQVTNHGIPFELLEKVRTVARAFFELPITEKEIYANNPSSYEGYGSRLGTDKDATLDWEDYLFVTLLPESRKDLSKWPARPALWRETMEQYAEHVLSICNKLLNAFSSNLNLTSPEILKQVFADSYLGLKVNYYPACPQPHLTLGVGSHCDIGGITILLQDDRVSGLQVRHNEQWVPIEPIPGALVVNLGDQMQILTNDKYKSVEHRVVVNSTKERLSLACFFEPGDDVAVAPLEELAWDESGNSAPIYSAMTYRQYKTVLRQVGSKAQDRWNSLSSRRQSVA